MTWRSGPVSRKPNPGNLFVDAQGRLVAVDFGIMGRLDAAMRRFAAKHFQYGTLGLVALAHASDREIQRNPIWLQWMMRFARAHANRFYNFRGLEQFRVKMRPQRWETLYAISNERRFSLRTLYSVGSAFSGIPPWMAIGIGAMKALGEEFRRLLPA